MRPVFVKAKRALRGLYHGKSIRKINRVSENKKKMIYHQKPNVHWHTLRSDLLDSGIRLRCTTKALRCIDRKGGLDNYILTTNDRMIPGRGQQLKAQLREAAHEQGVNVRALRESLRRKYLPNTPETIVAKRAQRLDNRKKMFVNPWLVETDDVHTSRRPQQQPSSSGGSGSGSSSTQPQAPVAPVNP